MRYTCEEDFDPATFPWSQDAAKTVAKIAAAGKMKELKEFLEERFGYHTQCADVIDLTVRQHSEEVLDELGLDKDGHKKKTKKFEVFFRVGGVVKQEVEAATPKEAAKKAYASLGRDGDPWFMIDRDDVEVLKPVAYNDENGNTKDYPEDFEVEDEW